MEDLLLKKFGNAFKKRQKPFLKETMENEIKQAILKHIPTKDLSAFRLPDEYSELLNTFEGNLSRNLSDGTWWKLLCDYEGVLSDLDYEYKNAMECESLAVVLSTPIFIPVGAWSDKHTYFLSCDQHYEFGKVFDCYDDFFWNLPNTEGPVADSIVDLLENEF